MGSGGAAAGTTGRGGEAGSSAVAGGTSTLFLQTCANGCSNGLCTGACTPGTTRCNRSGSSEVLEKCDGTGATWQLAQTCTSFCDAGTLTCATAAQNITADTTLDGVVVVDGAFVVYAGATVTSPTGNLTIYATSITVENGASIVVAATGTTPAGQGPAGTVNNTCSGSGRGGGYGSPGAVALACPGTGGPSFGSSTDDSVSPGSPGGPAESGGGCNPGAPGQGGGFLSLIASSSINIAGQISANGAQGGSSVCANWWGSGGGSGGGILLAADQLTVTGTISAAGGPVETPPRLRRAARAASGASSSSMDPATASRAPSRARGPTVCSPRSP